MPRPPDESTRHPGAVPEADRTRLRRELGLSDLRKQFPSGLPLYTDRELADAIVELLETS